MSPQIQVQEKYLSRLLFFMLSQTSRGGRIMLEIKEYLTGGREESSFPQSKLKLSKTSSIYICSNLSLSVGTSKWSTGLLWRIPLTLCKTQTLAQWINTTFSFLSLYSSTTKSWELPPVCASFHLALAWPSELQLVDSANDNQSWRSNPNPILTRDGPWSRRSA